jgi:1-deoxy-D-xylulose-5-phosphate reductoisomerase
MIVLGSTGSIGVNTLAIAKRFSKQIDVLVAGTNVKLLNEQIKQFAPKCVVISTKKLANKINHKNVLYGEEGILEAIESSNSSLVVNALVGSAGLKPTIKSLQLNKKLALANKESLVIAGKFLDTSNIIPIDSEHFGLWYLQNDKKVKQMSITASGGAFRDTPLESLQSVTVKQALNHPNWSMGQKITIDSATMVNKLFELLEAKWLFNINNLDAIIETKSLIHAFIEFEDGSTTAHFANANMQLPIAYAILDKVEENIIKPIDLKTINSLEFRQIEKKRYPIWEIKDFILQNPQLGVVFNTANDILVQRFLDGKINFLDISKNIITSIKKFENIKVENLEDIFEVQKEVKDFLVL